MFEASSPVQPSQASPLGSTQRRLVVSSIRAFFRQTERSLFHPAESSAAYCTDIEGHQKRVTDMATAIAFAMGLGAQERRALRCAAQMHDVGKLHLRREVFTKTETLTEADWKEIKKHPGLGAEIVRTQLPGSFGDHVARIVEQHHEKHDGSGYPHGLKGDEILLESRILGLADDIDAMMSQRSYKKGFSIARTRHALRDKDGTKFPEGFLDTVFTLLAQKSDQEENDHRTEKVLIRLFPGLHLTLG